jgi:hypothetical protein
MTAARRVRADGRVVFGVCWARVARVELLAMDTSSSCANDAEACGEHAAAPHVDL